ncbi:MAG TPA: hypothetical protein VFQ46_07825 [Candidatus Limnocylindria bacterium]|nr:hypothetical protein [Candidatus Limnocylindria bacterium]
MTDKGYFIRQEVMGSMVALDKEQQAALDALRAEIERLRAKQYDRSALVDTMTFHWPTPTSGCMCGWSDLGLSFPEHLADAYEAAAGEPVTGGV